MRLTLIVHVIHTYCWASMCKDIFIKTCCKSAWRVTILHCCVSAPFLLEKKQKLAKKKTHVISSSRIWTYNLSPHMIHSYHPTYISFAQLYGVLFILASIFLKFDQLFKCQNHIKSKAFQLKNRRSFRKPNNFHIQVSTDSY